MGNGNHIQSSLAGGRLVGIVFFFEGLEKGVEAQFKGEVKTLGIECDWGGVPPAETSLGAVF